MDKVLKKLKGQPTNQVDQQARTRVWVMTTGDTDRDGETVDPTGGNFSEFSLNPTVQWNHDTDSEPIGQIVGQPFNDYVGEGTNYPEILGPKRMALLGRVQFSRANPKAEQIWGQVQEGTVKGGSISFVPTGQTKRNSGGGNHYPEWKLLEFTLCSVGSNPSAVATSKKCLRCKAKCECKVHHLALPKMYEGSASYKEGWAAADSGYQPSANPYTPGGPAWKAWQEGYMAASRSKSVNKAGSVQDTVNGFDIVWDGTHYWLEEGGKRLNIGPFSDKRSAAFRAERIGVRQSHPGYKSLSGGEIHRLNKKGDSMRKRKAWVNPKVLMKRQDGTSYYGKSLWVLKSDGPVADGNGMLDGEMKDYLQMRGLDEVQVEDAPPKADDGYVQMAEDMAPPIGSDTGAMPPGGKAEDIADDVAMRATDLTGSGIANEPAVDMAMEERGLPKSMRVGIKHLALLKMVNKAAFSEGDSVKVVSGPSAGEKGTVTNADGSSMGQPGKIGVAIEGARGTGHVWFKPEQLSKSVSKADDDDKDKKKSVAAGKLVRTKRGNLCVVKSVEGKIARVVKVNGDEEEVKAKELKTIKKSADWGLPSKITAWGDMQAKLTNWYGNLVGMVKGLPALKNADLTGEEQKDVEDAVDEAFMKAADDLDLKGFMAQPPPAPARKADDDDKKDKTSDSIVPQDDVPGSNSPDMSLAIGSNASPDKPGNDLSTVPQGKLPNSNPGKAFPRKELKAYAKHVAAKVAKSHAPKLQRTIAKRASKFIVKWVSKAAPENMSPGAACAKLKDDNGELTSVERGMLGACCARGDKKLSKKFPGGCGKSPKCRKGWLCKKCVKRLVRKADGSMMTNAAVESPLPLGTTQGVQVRATPDGQFETWNTSTGQCVDGPYPSYDAASEALSKSLQKDAGTMDLKPQSTISNLEGSPTGGGTMELKADDDDDKVQKRGNKLLTKADDDDADDKALKDLQKQLDAAAKAIDGFGKKVYQQTAMRI